MSSTQRSSDPEWDDRERFTCASVAAGAGVVRVTVTGELDLATAPRLADTLAEASGGADVVILDLSEVTFVDSSGLQVILATHTRVAKADRRLVIVPGGPQVQQLFELTGVDKRLEFANARDAHRLAAVRSH